MTRFALILVAAFALGQSFAPALHAQDRARLDDLFTALREAPAGGWEAIEEQIWDQWSHSGSPAMDLLLQRGRDALAAEDIEAAIEHLTALVDMAPDFAEGWNMRATAYYKAGLVGPALADIGRVLTLEPRHFGALTGLGLILEESGDLAGAVGAYGAALAIHPHRADLREAIERLEEELQGEPI
ncbi:MAG TPA: tetratricopeptide repeat protein [Rhodobacterales bacterium]|nr:tetratricopeptide repeat protein [Rhodobacterales bacterium]